MDGRAGWARPAPSPLPEERARRVAKIRAEFEEMDERARAMREALFGPLDTDAAVTSRDLPVCTRRMYWRQDGHYAVAGPEDTNLTDDLWQPWTAGHASGTGEVAVGDVDRPTWWTWWGTCRPADNVRAWLSDDTDVDVVRLGGLWAAEFISLPTTLFVQAGDTTLNCVQHRPHYLPPPAHPIQPATTNPRP
jgi:hypothetical protein